MITVQFAADACEQVLGHIPNVRVSSGSVAATVMLGDDPVISISPLQGQVLIGTQRWLRARPKQTATLIHKTSGRDEDWQYCTATYVRELYHALHLAVPALEHRAMLPQRIAAKLGGVVQPRLHETDPKYWIALARWADGSGLLSRNDAKFARIYAKKLRKGEKSSDAFRAWAVRTSAAAIESGFPATEPLHIAPDPAGEGALDGFYSLELESSMGAAPGDATVPLPVQPLVDQLRQFEVAEIMAVGATAPADEDAAARVRAAVVRAGARDQQRAAKSAVAGAIRDLQERVGDCEAIRRVQVLAADTAAALMVIDLLDPTVAAAAMEPWQRATGKRLGPSGKWALARAHDIGDRRQPRSGRPAPSHGTLGRC